ncbi:MAG: sulfite exporter TauE/SafE family protein [Dehalococcoidia bacterium]|nr:sulfite exporter TauE/SafE family protein [Dehalococcoidia bacterium]
MGLAPAQAIGAGLLTELASTGFATTNYLRQKVVDFRTARLLLLAAVPVIVACSFISHLVEPGLPEITTTQLVARCHLTPLNAVATSIFVLAVKRSCRCRHPCPASPACLACGGAVRLLRGGGCPNRPENRTPAYHPRYGVYPGQPVCRLEPGGGSVTPTGVRPRFWRPS